MSTPTTTEELRSPRIQPSNADIFAQGLLQLLQPVVLECDTRMAAVFQSQAELSDQIDQLAKELENFMVVAQKNPPPALLPAVQTLLKAKTRVNSLNSTLNIIKDRLDRMEKIANTDQNSAIPIPEVFSSLLGKLSSSSNTQVQQSQKPVAQQPPAASQPTQSETPAQEKAKEEVNVDTPKS